MTATEQHGPRRRRRRHRWSRRARVVLVSVLTFVLTLGGAAAWALDRFVIEHVEISDVDAYEAAQSGTTSTDDATSDDTSSTEATITGTTVSSSTATTTTFTSGNCWPSRMA
ncbi:MAG: hypothetical protein KJ548_10955, partial [Actinobacteria bacterium]|nr:hypothetical protein [Actinomycetota bacterium]